MTGEEEVPAHTNVIEREIVLVIEEDNPLEKIAMAAEGMPHLTEDVAALGQILEIKTVVPMRTEEEVLINMILPTAVSETINMIASQETLHLPVINLSTVEVMLKVVDSAMDNLAVVSPTVGPIITGATAAQTPDIPHLDRTTITETTAAATTTPAKATLNSHAVTPVDNVSLCLSVLAEICWL